MKFAIKIAGSFLPLLLLLLLQSGCTYALWTNDNLVAYKEPAQNPNLRLFESTQRKDFPVFYSAPGSDFSKGIYAVCDTNQETFALYSGNREIGPYDFPVYHDHWGNVEKVALTPVAVTADVAVAGGIAAVYVAYGLAQGDCSFQVGK